MNDQPEIRPLDKARQERLWELVDSTIATEVIRFATYAGVSASAIERASDGEEITPRIRERIERAIDGNPIRAADQVAAAPAPAAPVTEPPTAPPQTAPTTEPTMPEQPDPLLVKLEAALTERGYGSASRLCRSIGIHVSGCHHWKAAGRIPPQHREMVEAWIAGPWESPAKAPAKPEKAPKAAIVRGKPTATITATSGPAAPAVSRPVVVTGAPVQVVRQVLDALGCEPRKVYVIEGGELVERMGVVVG